MTSRASLSSPGLQGNGSSQVPSFSGDGRYVEFFTTATNLVHGGWSSRELVRDRLGFSTTIATYGTAGTSTHGCTPSITGVGVPSTSAGSGFSVLVGGVEGQRRELIFFGMPGAQASPFAGGASQLCVRAPLQRTGVQFSGGTSGVCDGQFALDWNQFVAASPGLPRRPLLGGETVWAQAWYRAPAAPGGSNTSNGLWFTVWP